MMARNTQLAGRRARDVLRIRRSGRALSSDECAGVQWWWPQWRSRPPRGPRGTHQCWRTLGASSSPHVARAGDRLPAPISSGGHTNTCVHRHRLEHLR
jgi:hypothetical protein